MAEKKSHPNDHSEGLVIHPVRGREFLNGDPEALFQKGKSINGKTVAGKWTRAILPVKTRDLLDELENHDDIMRFDDVAQVDVGIVTGANKFFLIDDATVKKYRLKKWAHPMFGRSQHCPGIIYDEAQHQRNAVKGDPTNFVWFTNNDVERHKVARTYIEYGERQNLHTRYKCRIRKNWYSVPSVYSTEVGMLKRAHDTPRLILNEISAFTTDTAYRVRTRRGSASQLVYGFMNSLTALSAELEGRHYGGGVLELVPSEIERLLVPNPEKIKPNLKALDRSVRDLKSDSVLVQQSSHVLGDLGVSKQDQEELYQGWDKLRNRRQRISTEAA
jgi:adenine-specific DNA methylase